VTKRKQVSKPILELEKFLSYRYFHEVSTIRRNTMYDPNNLYWNVIVLVRQEIYA
jgi:hypothetical protein